MDYRKHYKNLIVKVKDRDIIEGYTENHHILPKCIKNNGRTVPLTGREHYIAHQLLYNIYKGTKWEAKLAYAWWSMCRSNKYHKRDITSRQYETARKICVKATSGKNNYFYGKHHTEEWKKEISEIMKKAHADPNSVYNSKECRKKISDNHIDVSGKNNPMYGKHHTEKSRKNISESQKMLRTDPNHIFNSKEFKNKISEGVKKAYADPNSTFNSEEYKKNRIEGIRKVKFTEWKFFLPDETIEIVKSPSRFINKYNKEHGTNVNTGKFWRMKLNEIRETDCIKCERIKRRI